MLEERDVDALVGSYRACLCVNRWGQKACAGGVWGGGRGEGLPDIQAAQPAIPLAQPKCEPTKGGWQGKQ